MAMPAPQPVHVPVMPREVIQWLQLSPGLTVLDGTVGAGGHSSLILRQLGETGRLIGLDRDAMMLQRASTVLQDPRCTLHAGSYANAMEILSQLNVPQVDRVLLDLGLSSDQLADSSRGFGFDAGGPLDMRFDTSTGPTAADLLRNGTSGELAAIFEEYGEEPAAGRLAAEIVRRRTAGQVIETSEELENCVNAVLGTNRRSADRNPATRVFQALRIAVNQELLHVRRMLTDVLPKLLKPGGIAVVISFHSLEDRITKSAFKGNQGWHLLTKTPVVAQPAEIRLNPRSRSAKLRAARWTNVPSSGT
jgi:16S rRNA (cytosine1402-N4)-methyltransferase